MALVATIPLGGSGCGSVAAGFATAAIGRRTLGSAMFAGFGSAEPDRGEPVVHSLRDSLALLTGAEAVLTSAEAALIGSTTVLIAGGVVMIAGDDFVVFGRRLVVRTTATIG